MRDIRAVISDALPLCEPTPAERRKISAVADGCMKLVRNTASGKAEILDIVFGGSFAKGTWLRGDADVDIFVKLARSLDMDSFERLGKTIGLSALAKYKPSLRYSDHPYVEAVVDGIRVNVVPCYEVEQGKWQSAADRSPFHTDFIKQRFGEFEKSQTRLLKAFLKSAGIYGAEISVGGFSGYVSEVLVLKYRSFEAVIRAAADLQARQVIAVDGSFDRDIVTGFFSQLIIIDPVDTRRNLGTAISPESVGKFALAARSFLSDPSLRFFKESVSSGGATKALRSNLLIVEFRHRERSPDVVWGQLKRSLGAITKQLELAGFEVFRSSCVTDEKNSAALAFLVNSLTLSPLMMRKGPQVYMKDNSASFLRNPKTAPHIAWVDSEMRVAMVVDRKETEARAYVKSLFGNKSENSGISKDLLAHRAVLRVYSAKERKLTGLAKEAVDRVASTEHFMRRS